MGQKIKLVLVVTRTRDKELAEEYIQKHKRLGLLLVWAPRWTCVVGWDPRMTYYVGLGDFDVGDEGSEKAYWWCRDHYQQWD